MAHREGGPQDEASKSRFSGFLRVLWCGGPDSLVNGLPARLAGSENLGQAPRLERGLPTHHRMLSGGPKWLIVRGSPGRGDFLGFCMFCGAEGISRA